MSLKKIILDIQGTKDFENLSRILPSLGPKIHLLISEADKADKELSLVHNCITELYNKDFNVPLIKDCLSKIRKIQ